MKSSLRLCLVLCLPVILGAAGPKRIDLWPEDAPDKKTDQPDEEKNGAVTRVYRPSLTLFPASKPNGTSIVICPGGGYSVLVAGKEGAVAAEWFNSIGVTAY